MIKSTVEKCNACAVQHSLYLFISGMLGIVIFILSVIPGFFGRINSGPPAHSLAYFTLSFFIALYFRGKSGRHPLIKGALLAGLYGACIEWVQFYIPYRSCELADIGANFLAAVVAMLPGAFLIKNKWV
ncbi:MAG: VanZ family protein [Pseudomonadota bacterium]